MPEPRVALDAYVIDTLMRDLVGHDRSVASFLVFLLLWRRVRGLEQRRVAISLQQLADETGLSRRGIQIALRRLEDRGLVASARAHATAIPEYRIVCPWRRRKKRAR